MAPRLTSISGTFTLYPTRGSFSRAKIVIFVESKSLTMPSMLLNTLLRKVQLFFLATRFSFSFSFLGNFFCMNLYCVVDFRLWVFCFGLKVWNLRSEMLQAWKFINSSEMEVTQLEFLNALCVTSIFFNLLQGMGLSAKECEICDFFVYIPQYGGGTASLNVTVAASIVLHHFGGNYWG